MAVVEKTEFKNRSGGHLGVVTLDRDGKPVGTNVEPGGTQFLSDEEIRLTADAPQSPDDNPFVAKKHAIRDPQTGDVVEEGVWAALEMVTAKRPVPDGARAGDERFVPQPHSQETETGADVPPPPPAPEGSYRPGEEVGTPGAQGQ